MPAGIETFDVNGQLIISTTTKLARILGTQFVGTGSGTIVNSAFQQGTPFFVFQTLGLDDGVGQFRSNASVVGDTLSWSNPGNAATIIYGVY